MSKIIAYQELLDKISQLDLYLKVDSYRLVRGNIAFWVEGYYETENWDKKLNRLLSLIEKKDINEACWVFYHDLQEIFLARYGSENSEQVKNLIDIWEISQKLNSETYAKKALKSFNAISDIFFPDWFIKYEDMMRIAKRYSNNL